MNKINKTLYIPLYGKAHVSKKNIILSDKKAEEIWEKEQFKLKGKSKSKWLAYFMAMRSYVFDQWLKDNIKNDSIVLHIGCGMDSRCLRVQCSNQWYDIDFSEVIKERKKYYFNTQTYNMIEGDIRNLSCLDHINKGNAIVVMEGVSMYLKKKELLDFFELLNDHFTNVHILIDTYTIFAAKVSKYKNPINDVGVTEVYGLDNPRDLEVLDIKYIKEHSITPKTKIDELKRIEKIIFKNLFAGKISKTMYRLYEYRKDVYE